MRSLFATALFGGCILGCQYLPLSKNPVKPPPNVPDYSAPVFSSARPILKTGEFLLADTIEDADGVLLFVSNRIPAAGTMVEFYESGQKRMAIPFLDGHRQGTAQWWNPDGQLKHTRQYLEGKLNGVWVEYYPGSKIRRQEQLYDEGTEILRRGWWPNGAKQFEVIFANGFEQTRKSWGIDGAAISSRTRLPAPSGDSNSSTPTAP